MDNIDHIPGGGDKLVSQLTASWDYCLCFDINHPALFLLNWLHFRECAQSKCGSLDYIDHIPGGGDKLVSHLTTSWYYCLCFDINHLALFLLDWLWNTNTCYNVSFCNKSASYVKNMIIVIFRQKPFCIWAVCFIDPSRKCASCPLSARLDVEQPNVCCVFHFVINWPDM